MAKRKKPNWITFGMDPMPIEQPAIELSDDPTIVKIHLNALIAKLRDEDGKTKTRELALAMTKMQEATMWIDEHLRLH